MPTSDYAVPRIGASTTLSGRVIDFTTNTGVSGAKLEFGDRGDFLVRPGNCVARYGTVADGLTLLPITGATVALLGSSNVTDSTDSTGWYRIDLGCPSNGLVGFNTTVVTVSHPDYRLSAVDAT